jgi:hypothetical protein
MWGPHRHRGSTHRPEMPAPQTRRVGLAAQAFALLGTLVGVFTIAIGVGPRSGPDIAYHVAIAAALVWGLVVAKRAPDDQAGQHT